MILLTDKDFETKHGQKRIINAIHRMDVKIRELELLMKASQEEEQHLERDIREINQNPNE